MGPDVPGWRAELGGEVEGRACPQPSCRLPKPGETVELPAACSEAIRARWPPSALNPQRARGAHPGPRALVSTQGVDSTSATPPARRSPLVRPAPQFHMKNPPHPGLSVRHDCLEPLGLSVTEPAHRLGVGRKQLSDVVKGRSGIPPVMPIRLHKAFGGGAETWYRLQAAYDPAQAMEHADQVDVERLTVTIT